MNAKLLKHFGRKPIVWVPIWGISKIRHRGGKFAGGIEGEGEWYAQWYDKVMSEETVRRLAEDGVNLIVLPFSIGGRPEDEREERDDFSRMTELLHRHGIVSLPYLQYQNILHERFEFPETTWAVHLDGSRKQFTYWRRTVCQSSTPFLEYMKDSITDAMQRGADGIWIDNTHLAPCRCKECDPNFKQWLTVHRPHLLDELHLEDFSRIEMPPSMSATFDPIVQALMEFNNQRSLNILSTLKNHLERLSPDAIFSSNPGFYRGSSNSELYGKGIDFYPYTQLHDMVYLENKFFPVVSDGQTTGNYHGHISCRAAGCMAVPGGWKLAEFDSTEHAVGAIASGFPQTGEEVRRVLFESAAFGGVIGMLWSVRSLPESMCSSADDLLSLYQDHPPIAEASKVALRFLHSLPVFGASQNVAPIAVLRHRESLALHSNYAWPATHAAEELLLRGGLPYNVLFSEEWDDSADRFPLIILPEVAVLDEVEAASITRYVEKGGKLLVLGNCGIYNRRMQTRVDFLLKDLLGVSRFQRSENMVLRSYGKGTVASLTMKGSGHTLIRNIMRPDPALVFPLWYEHKDQILQTIDFLLGEKRPVRVLSPEALAVTLWQTQDGDTAIHLLSYSMHPEPVTVKLEVSAHWWQNAKQASWHTPDQPVVNIAIDQSDAGRAYLTLSGFRDYGVVLF